MKALLTAKADPQADIAAEDLAEQIKSLFAACPNLCGFVLEDLSRLHGDAGPYDRESRFVITQVSFGTPSSQDEAQQVCNLIASAVSELVAAQPEASELLRGRTFARTLH